MFKKFLFLVLVLIGTSFTASSQPAFTGDVTADFSSIPGAVLFSDPAGNDVGVPAQLGAVISGWDMKEVYFFYDSSADNMFVGVNCYGICGDADGDGDPSNTSAELASIGGVDTANYGGSESFVLSIDTNLDQVDNSATCTNLETIIGLDGITHDINDFSAYLPNAGCSPFALGVGFGGLLGGASVVVNHHNPSAAQPDIEFEIQNFSQLPNVAWNIGEAFLLRVNLFQGSFGDAGVGEDSMPGSAKYTDLTFASNLASDKTDSLLLDNNTDGVANPGDQIRYTVNISNLNSTLEIQNLMFDDTVDSNTALIHGSVTTSQGSVTTGNSAVVGMLPDDNQVQVNVGSLAINDTITISYDVEVRSTIASTVVEVINQGVINATGVVDFLTDDPDTGAVDDPTITTIIVSAVSPQIIPSLGYWSLLLLMFGLLVFTKKFTKA